MADLNTLLQDAKEGALDTCQRCPWSPAVLGPIAFGTSCCEHGVDYSSSVGAVSVQVAQDPGGTTPERTGRLCSVHNRHEPTDRTAQNVFSLWKAAVARRQDGDGDKYLHGHYWTNAIMHGAPKDSRVGMEKARKHCSFILREQIYALSPKVVIALGKVAADSLFDAGFLSRRWPEFRDCLSTGAYTESKALSGFETSIFCTYHTAGIVVNRVVSPLYSSRTEELLSQRIEKLEDQPAVHDFLMKNPIDTTNGRGMRVLLLHWLDIGEAIRDAHKADTNRP